MIALEKSLGTEVDIVTVDFDELDDYLKEAILKDGILVYEETAYASSTDKKYLKVGTN